MIDEEQNQEPDLLTKKSLQIYLIKPQSVWFKADSVILFLLDHDHDPCDDVSTDPPVIVQTINMKYRPTMEDYFASCLEFVLRAPEHSPT